MKEGNIALLTELGGLITAMVFYKHRTPSGVVNCVARRTIEHYSMNLKTYFSSKAISNFLSSVRYSSLNDRRL